MELMKIGQFSKLCGTTVRTLRHYDELGLLVPNKSDNGIKLYGLNEQQRFQQIQALKYLGFSLDNIKETLQNNLTLGKLYQQKVKLKKRQEELTNVIDLIERAEVQGELDNDAVANLYLMINMFLLEEEQTKLLEHYATKEQLAILFKHYAPENRVKQDIENAEWYARIKQLMDQGIQPDSYDAQCIANDYIKLVEKWSPSEEELKILSPLLHQEQFADEYIQLSKRFISSDLQNYMERMMSSFTNKHFE